MNAKYYLSSSSCNSNCQLTCLQVLERRVWATQPNTQAPPVKDVAAAQAAKPLSKSIAPALASFQAPLQSSTAHMLKQV